MLSTMLKETGIKIEKNLDAITSKIREKEDLIAHIFDQYDKEAY